ncbi:DUF1642 domain-containing protein [Streptococcus uberis]|uniref:DUF1642 domain-containing protein n=1 Tax=Streptococcus uberis TaxID=1349 RepID=UPI000620F763|nr:DUF1642 domain-containing protein [Streptococcus uberis]KKF60583.1 hypothetical protein AF58_00570 [Streptococcus uberis C6344]
MKIEKLKQGQAVWVKGFVDRSVFGGCGGFIDFYNQDGNHCGHISRNNVREMKEEDVQIDQPKPVVQKFLADWYEEHKDNFYLNLHRLAWELIKNLDEDDFVPEKAIDSDFKRWYHKTETAIQTLINMHQFGYTVEKEKLYNVSVLGCTLFKMTSDDLVKYKLIGENETLSEPVLSLYKFEANLTEKEIKQADERLWQLAESAF